jgi:hypothetical protein
MIQKVRSKTINPTLNSGLTISAGTLTVAAGALLKTNVGLVSNIVGGLVASSGPAYSAVQAVAYTAAIILNAATGDKYDVAALTGNVTSFTVNNLQNGQLMQICFIQDGTGNRTITLPGTYKIIGAISGVPNSVNILTLYKPSISAFIHATWTNYPA